MDLSFENMKDALKVIFNKQVDISAEIIECETYEEYYRYIKTQEKAIGLKEENIPKWEKSYLLTEEEWELIQGTREKVCYNN